MINESETAEINKREMPSKSEQATALVKNIILFILTASTFVALAMIPGQSDILFAASWLLICIIMCIRIYNLRSGLRSIKKQIFQEGSFFHNFFSRKNLFQLIVSVLLAVFVSMVFLVTLKMLVLKHGMFQVLIPMLLPVLFLQKTRDNLYSFSAEDSMSEEEAKKTVAELVDIITRAGMIALFISLLFSILDVFAFYQSTYGFSNFVSHAANHAIPLNDGGHYARALVNISVVADAFNMALINELFNVFGFDKTSISPLLFFLLVFPFNMLKLLPFCVAYIFIVTMLQSKVLDWSETAYLKVRAKIRIIRSSSQDATDNDFAGE